MTTTMMRKATLFLKKRKRKQPNHAGRSPPHIIALVPISPSHFAICPLAHLIIIRIETCEIILYAERQYRQHISHQSEKLIPPCEIILWLNANLHPQEACQPGTRQHTPCVPRSKNRARIIARILIILIIITRPWTLVLHRLPPHRLHGHLHPWNNSSSKKSKSQQQPSHRDDQKKNASSIVDSHHPCCPW